jgi:hypothetical protein
VFISVPNFLVFLCVLRVLRGSLALFFFAPSRLCVIQSISMWPFSGTVQTYKNGVMITSKSSAAIPRPRPSPNDERLAPSPTGRVPHAPPHVPHARTTKIRRQPNLAKHGNLLRKNTWRNSAQLRSLPRFCLPGSNLPAPCPPKPVPLCPLPGNTRPAPKQLGRFGETRKSQSNNVSASAAGPLFFLHRRPPKPKPSADLAITRQIHYLSQSETSITAVVALQITTYNS